MIAPSAGRLPDQIGRIVATRGVVGGRPRLAGTRMETAFVWSAFKDFGLDGMLDAYPWLTETDVLVAVAFEQGRRHRKAKKR